MNHNNRDNGDRRVSDGDARVDVFLRRARRIMDTELAHTERVDYAAVAREGARRRAGDRPWLSAVVRAREAMRRMAIFIAGVSRPRRYVAVAAAVAVAIVGVLLFATSDSLARAAFRVIDDGVGLTSSQFSTEPLYEFEMFLAGF